MIGNIQLKRITEMAKSKTERILSALSNGINRQGRHIAIISFLVKRRWNITEFPPGIGEVTTKKEVQNEKRI